MEPSSAQRVEGAVVSVRGTVCQPPTSELRGGAAQPPGPRRDGQSCRLGPVVAPKESAQEQVRKGNQVREEPPPPPTPPGARGQLTAPRPVRVLSSTPQHSASRGTACRRDGRSAGSSLGLWAPQTGGSGSPAGTRHMWRTPGLGAAAQGPHGVGTQPAFADGVD